MRLVERDERTTAMTLAARAFQGEPFLAELFGEEPVRRFALGQRFYQAMPWSEVNLGIGAFIGDVMVGMSVVSPYGRCQLCELIDPAKPPDDPLFALEWQFEVNVLAAHADQAPHAWVSRVIVDPALQGAGIGRRLIAESAERLHGDGGGSVLLECQPHRESFYVGCGFHRVRTFPDPAGPDALLMRLDLDG